MSGRRRAGDPAPLVGFGPALGANVDDANGSALGLLLDSLERAERDVRANDARARGDDDANHESSSRTPYGYGPNVYEVLGDSVRASISRASPGARQSRPRSARRELARVGKPCA